MVVVLLLHEPPVVASDNVTVLPTHTCDAPVIAAGVVPTVTTAVTVQPVPSEYVIVDTPGATPVISPVSEPAVAIKVLLLVHVPPPTVLPNVVVCPTQVRRMPVIIPGALFTVTRRVAVQPDVPVKVISDVPGAMPVTTPDVSPAVAIAVLPLTYA
jgi:hypothetical protein